MDYSPSSAFTNAASYLSSASSLRKVDNNTKLELYGLYKYLTVSTVPSSSRPSIFDMTGRAKWDAWQRAGQMYHNAPDAEKRYLEIACRLGWEESAVQSNAGTASSNKGKEKATDGDIWDSDSERSPTSDDGGGAGGGGAGMVVVSSMRPPTPTDEDKTLHGLVLSGDVNKLDSFVESQSALDINTRDEYGYTALHLACDRGNAPIVELLLRKGADITIQDVDGLTASQLAKEAGHEHIVQLFSQ